MGNVNPRTTGIVASGLLLLVIACAQTDREAAQDGASAEALEVATSGGGAGAGPAAPPPDRIARAGDEDEDRRIFEATMEWAHAENLPSLPIGQRVAALGKRFVGSAYVPGTLEVTPERLVVNLREFDCVTFVESMLAMARVLDRPTQTFEDFRDELRTIRYRGGVLDGYPSRLHYFSDWISDNEKLGIVRDVTRELGGVPLDETIDFMTTHRDQYPALASDEVFRQIAEQEAVLSGRQLYYIPESEIARVAPQIEEGDIIAATSAIRGLDIAHTGIAIRIDGRLHLMHAPLVGRNVEISERPLAERILGIEGQDGIMVARPLPVD